MVDITGGVLFFVLIAILIIVIIADFIHMHRKVGWQYPLLRRATYIGIAGIGVILIIAVPLKPSLGQPLTDQITVGAIGIALGAIGYTILNQLDFDYKHTKFEETVKQDLQQIKTHLGITNEPMTSNVVNPSPSLSDAEKQAKWFNASMLFLSLVVTIATACAIAVAVLALPSDKIWTGIGIEVLFILLIIGTGFFVKGLFKI
jgi:disulfide bond formation protein DsbB